MLHINSNRSFFGRAHRVALLSALVVVFWGLTAWLRMVAAVPALELTGIAMAGAAAGSWLLPGYAHPVRAALRQPWYAWVVIIAGMIGGAAFYFVALSYAPAEQVVVITYTWPLFFALASDARNHRRPSPWTLFALLLGLAGVAVMHGWSQTSHSDAWIGYTASLLSGLCWAGFSLFLQNYRRSVGQAYPAFFAASALVALVLQAAFGGLVFPQSLQGLTASLFLGIGPYGLGFIAWGYVVRHGNPRVVPVLPYAVPGVAAAALVLLGRAQPTIQLIAGCVIVMAACAAAIHQGNLKDGKGVQHDKNRNDKKGH